MLSQICHNAEHSASALCADELKITKFHINFHQLFSQTLHPISDGNLLVCSWDTREDPRVLQEFHLIFSWVIQLGKMHCIIN